MIVGWIVSSLKWIKLRKDKDMYFATPTKLGLEVKPSGVLHSESNYC